MVEIWKDINEYNGIYQVSNRGRVRSLDRVSSNGRNIKGKLLSLSIVSNYLVVSLYKNSNRRSVLVHRLVAEAFIPNPYNLPVVNHINHIKTDNSVENLEWCSYHYNSKDYVIYKTGNYKDSHNYEGLHKCSNCGATINYKSNLCRSCIDIKKTSHRIPKYDIIESLTRNSGNFTQAAKEFNMSDNALRKWCRKYGLPSKSSQW